MQNKMTKDIKERAHNKAFSKIITLKRDVRGLNTDIRSGNSGRLSVNLLQTCLKSTKLELETWQYIAKLIEINE